MKSAFNYIILIVTLVLTSCSTPRMFTTLDLLRPADVTFKPEAKHVLIVNNAVTQADNMGHYRLNNVTGDTISESLKFDSAAVFCNASLYEGLEESQFFNSVQILYVKQNFTNNFHKIAPLDKEKVRTLCDIYNVDAIISLDHVLTRDYTGEYYYTDTYNTYAALHIDVYSTWSIHYPDDSKPAYFQYADEFSWEDRTISRLPDRYDALVDASLLTGSNVVDRLIPRWEKQERYFYTPKKPLMIQAMDSVAHRNWEAAILLWQKAANETKNSSLKFYAVNNIAIAYEVLGDYDKAIDYALQAVHLYEHVFVFNISQHQGIYSALEYLEFLKKRKEEIELLNKQLSD